MDLSNAELIAFTTRGESGGPELRYSFGAGSDRTLSAAAIDRLEGPDAAVAKRHLARIRGGRTPVGPDLPLP